MSDLKLNPDSMESFAFVQTNTLIILIWYSKVQQYYILEILADKKFISSMAQLWNSSTSFKLVTEIN